MIEWKNRDEEAPPTDRVIMISSGWSWRREDYHAPEVKDRRGKVVRPARVVPSKDIVGGIFLAYWNPDFGKDGGYAVCGMKGLAPNFRFWAEPNNPISQDQSLSDQVVTNMVPETSTMPHYQPSQAELKHRQFREMLGL